MKETIKEALKIPLIWMLFGWNIMLAFGVLWCAYRLTCWMFGFWKCCICKKWYWVDSKNHNAYGAAFEAQCENCKDERLPSDKPIVQKPSARITRVNDVKVLMPPKGGSSVRKGKE